MKNFVIILIFVIIIVMLFMCLYEFINNNWYKNAIREISNECPITTESLREDLVLMQEKITPLYDEPSRTFPKYTQGELFELEDMGNNETVYDWMAAEWNLNKNAILMEIEKKYFDSIMKAKEYFNKPRPKIMSSILNVPITIHDTPTAQAPALPSGHAIQALMFGAIVFRDNKTIDVDLIAQRCLEVGFRRVVGGVHYPADVKGAILFVICATKRWGIRELHNKYIEYAEEWFYDDEKI
jgi:hypothetical protein